MKLELIVASAGMLLVLGGAGACTSGGDGTLIQSWTIAGTVAPTACTVAGASQARLVLVNSEGFTQATNFTSCDAFATTLSLPEATYTGTMTFLDRNGVAVSVTKDIPTFQISEGRTTNQGIDFGPSDFRTR